MPTVYVFFDYVCPYAYVGKLRADKLARELKTIRFEWVPWEIFPTTAPMGERMAPRYLEPNPANAWVERLAQEVGGSFNRPTTSMNSNLALRGAEYAKDQGEGVFERYHTLLFEAVWKENLNIGDPAVLAEIATRAHLDAKGFLEGIHHRAYQARLVEADSAATRLGVQRVPTFVFGDQRIVGNDPFDASLRQPLLAFLERYQALGEDWTTTLEEDVGLGALQ